MTLTIIAIVAADMVCVLLVLLLFGKGTLIWRTTHIVDTYISLK